MKGFSTFIKKKRKEDRRNKNKTVRTPDLTEYIIFVINLFF